MRPILGAVLVLLAFAACDVPQPTEPTAASAGLLASSSGLKDAFDDDEDDADETRLYDVTITNLTTGQPFSPGVVATHTKRRNVWRPRARASEGVRLIAENGEPDVAVASLSGSPGFADVQAVPAPTGCLGCPGPFGSSLTVRVAARENANRLSLVVMLICTNDGFVGLNGVALPRGNRPATFYPNTYDAGTEANDQLSSHIVDPCFAIGPTGGPADGNLRTATTGVIARHPGIEEVGDLDPDVHGWRDPVARVTVQRVR